MMPALQSAEVDVCRNASFLAVGFLPSSVYAATIQTYDNSEFSVDVRPLQMQSDS